MRSCFDMCSCLLRVIRRNAILPKSSKFLYSTLSTEEAHRLHYDLFGLHPGTGTLYLVHKWIIPASEPFLWGLFPKKYEGLLNTESITLSATKYTQKDFHTKCNMSKEYALSSWASFINPRCIKACNKHMRHEYMKHGRALKMEPRMFTFAATTLSNAARVCLSDFQFNPGKPLTMAAVNSGLRGCLSKLEVLGYPVGIDVSIKMVCYPSPDEDCVYFDHWKIAFAKSIEKGVLTFRLCDAKLPTYQSESLDASETDEPTWVIFPTSDSPQLKNE